MSLQTFIDDAHQSLESFWDDNSNTILMVGSLVGLGAALYFTARGAVKADRKVQELTATKQAANEELTTVDILKTAVPEYIPSVAAAAFTIACIISNHHINEEQKIALCGVYAMLGKSYEKYRNKTREIAGEEVAKEIDIAMAEDVRVRQVGGVFGYKDDLYDAETGGYHIFYDPFSESHFVTTPEQVRSAEYHINRNLALRGDVSLWEFYQFLGIEDKITKNRREINKLKKLGWDTDFLMEEYEQNWIDFDHEFVEMDTGEDVKRGYCIIQPVIQPRILDYPYTYCGGMPDCSVLD